MTSDTLPPFVPTTSVPAVAPAPEQDLDAVLKDILKQADKELNEEVIAKAKRQLKANAEDIRKAKKVVQNFEFQRTRIIEEIKAELAL